MDQLTKILEWVCLFVGPCLLVYSLISVVRTRDFIRRSTEVAGEVIRLERSAGDGRFASYVYAPVFSFTSADGKTYTVTSDVSSSPPDFTIGESVRVRYDPANPEKARIHSFFQTWGVAFIAGACALIFIIVSCKLLGFL
jgi:Protein of unknown function (DUF3592)